jgi:hypothetical protein
MNGSRGTSAINIDAGRAEAFDQAYRRAAEALDASEHCERYQVSRCHRGSNPARPSHRNRTPRTDTFRGSVGARSSAASLRRRPVSVHQHRGDASLPGDALEY